MVTTQEPARAAAPASPEPAPPIEIPRTSAAPRKPVQLQMQRTAGVFVRVCSFDADSELEEHYARTAAEILCALDASLRFRIVRVTFGAVDVLTTYSAADGWRTGIN